MSGGDLKKRHDPLWEIVGEKVPLQGSESTLNVVCPHCHVTVQVPDSIIPGQRFKCGLCGGSCEFLGSTQGGLARAQQVQVEE